MSYYVLIAAGIAKATETAEEGRALWAVALPAVARFPLAPATPLLRPW